MAGGKRLKVVRMYSDDLTFQIVDEQLVVLSQVTLGWGEIIDMVGQIFRHWSSIERDK